jgi:WD repeat-containing protein 19
MIYDGKSVHSFIYVPVSIKGPVLIQLGPISVSSDGEVKLTPDKVDIASGHIPLLCSGGVLSCQTSSGNVTNIIHPFFTDIGEPRMSSSSTSSRRPTAEAGSKKDKKILANKFCQALALLKLEQAWEAALDLDKRQFWLALSGKAMELLNIELAIRVYRQLGDAGMVMALQQCSHMEDRNLLAGHISLLFCDYQRAQDLFMNSSYPTAALDMRRDLLQV